MTYGPPPNQPPHFPQTPGQPAPPIPGQPGVPTSSVTQRMLVPTAPPNRKTLVVGVGAAVLGVLLIAFSFLTWLSANISTSQSLPGVGDMSVSMDMTVTGMGSDSIDVDLDLPSGVPDSFREQFQQGFDEGRSEGDDPGMPGIWMIVFGVIAIVGGVLLITRRFPGIGAVLTAVAGVAASIAAIVFVADPLGAFGGDIGEAPGGTTADAGAGYGLWLTLAFSLVTLAAGVVAVLLVSVPQKTDGNPASVFGAPQQFGGGPGYGQPVPGYQPGGFPPAAPQSPYWQQGRPQYGQQPPNFTPPQD